MIIAVVGMCGAGKSTLADILREQGFGFLRIGQITLDIIKSLGQEPTEENERPVRENLRKKHGMAAFVTLNMAKIEELYRKGHVVLDGVYSWEEFLELKKKYNDELLCLAVVASPKVRYERLQNRPFDYTTDIEMRNRPFTKEDAISRDYHEIETMNKGGPIAMADFTIVNEETKIELKKKVMKFLKSLS